MIWQNADEFDGIKDREAIEFFSKLVKNLPTKESKLKYIINDHIVELKDIKKHLRLRDDTGKTVMFAVKLYMHLINTPEWEKKFCEKVNQKTLSRRIGKKKKDQIAIVFLPDSYSHLKSAQDDLHDRLEKYRPIFLEGKNATRENVEREWGNSDSVYFITITEGRANKIFAQKDDQKDKVLFRTGDKFTRDISTKNHFHFVACRAGLVLAKSMAYFYGAKHVHAYHGSWWCLSDATPFINATSKVDIELLDGKTHEQAHNSCVNQYFLEAKNEWEKGGKHHRANAIALTLDGVTKCSDGPDSTLFNEIPSGTPTIHINKIEMEREIQNVWWLRKIRGKATVSVVDDQGKPVKGVNVSGIWSYNAINKSNGTTNVNGYVPLLSDWYWSHTGLFTFTVENIQKKGREYVAEENKETRGSIKIGRRWG